MSDPILPLAGRGSNAGAAAYAGAPFDVRRRERGTILMNTAERVQIRAIDHRKLLLEHQYDGTLRPNGKATVITL